jgi:hypothetical protein
MAHFYDCKKLDTPKLLSDVTTIKQALKAGPKVFASVTTIIGQTIKHPFLDSIHKPRTMVKYARMEEHWDKDWKEIEQLCYGMVEDPYGSLIPSSEFGTNVHNSCEKLLDCYVHGDQPEYSVYDAWAEPWLDWIIEQGHEIVATELPIADGTIKTCGTIDAVIKGAHSGEMILCDYKCRKSKQFYDKDLWQLAIESWMLKRRYKLDYLPQCMSICIEVGSKKHHHKCWSIEEQENAIEIVKLISKLYWKLRQ